MATYVGVDVSKYTLDVQMGAASFQVANQASGLRELIKALKKLIREDNESDAVVCEASGGYEKSLVCALQKTATPCTSPMRIKSEPSLNAKAIWRKRIGSIQSLSKRMPRRCKFRQMSHCYRPNKSN